MLQDFNPTKMWLGYELYTMFDTLVYDGPLRYVTLGVDSTWTIEAFKILPVKLAGNSPVKTKASSLG